MKKAVDQRLRAEQILQDASDHICSLAEDVGIDGSRLLHQLPMNGEMLKGKSVPVLETKYRSTCSALLYINHTRWGSWPFMRLHTFKHGGVERRFNGLQWARSRFSNGNDTLGRKSTSSHDIGFRSKSRQVDEDRLRATRHLALSQKHQRAAAIHTNHTWIKKRLCNLASQPLLDRLQIRCLGDQQLLVPFGNHIAGTVGYHQITSQPSHDEKRHFVYKSGQLTGSYIYIKPTAGKRTADRPVLICEGLATGLSLALVWPGEIRIALCANNLRAVRNNTHQPVIFCHDEDKWKPTSGNTGRIMAQAAMHLNDRLIAPQFLCSALLSQPTDFNDLLRLEGVATLRRQLEAVWPNASI
jgi:hypothetical protein